ncbi:MAG: hypothetical protein A2X25_09585 [Chloroflexi bacterium GWB2_49_20]|nr:MAG: hypothetical protein A2X25_09585 [Chloroflexi bacterium GWB2_49_20]OGN79642.1 MAG: hypothetical protein A2X26_04440 [Chloroflexi bacterium GWC2_49_37]OGN83046.1 MAG: hypothetical protein A2X27_08255 [Chloroflexi bacterium GWD2_49_16]
MIFKVLADRPLEVRDPDNDQILGSLDREKVRVKVSEVFELFSICRTYVTHTTVGRGGLMGITSAALLYGEPAKEVVETLKAEDHTLPPPLSEEESYVKRGDRVIIVKSPD